MKYLLPFLAAALLLSVACQSVTPEKPNVTALAINEGGTLRLTWTATGASGYNIYLDGVKYTTTSTSYDVTAPTKIIDVSGYSGSTESDKWTLNTGVVKTSSITVDDYAGAGPNYAFYFSTSGTALPIPSTQTSNVDFVLDTTGVSPELRGPTGYDPHLNEKDNASADAATTDLDAYTEAPASGVYSTARAINSDAVYALWIDQLPVGWGIEDHFAKMKVEGISSNTLTLSFGYQTVGGLRWLMNP